MVGDPVWRVNVRERTAYGATRYTPGIGHVIEEATETLQIYSYDPYGTSYQNTREVIAKWGCVNVRGREPERQSADDHAEPRYEVSLFFRESPVLFLIERYDGMIYVRIVKYLVQNRLGTEDFVDSFTEYLPGIVESPFDSCADRDPCLPARGSREWNAIYYEEREARHDSEY